MKLWQSDNELFKLARAELFTAVPICVGERHYSRWGFMFNDVSWPDEVISRPLNMARAD